MITKIISGGQVGADIAGLKVARDLNIETGGTVPKGWKTKHGPKPELSKLGLVEHESSSDYPPRTTMNIKNSDATIIFATNFNSPGTRLTITSCKTNGKPYFLVDITDKYGAFIFDVFDFFNEHSVHTLNVAGNAGKSKQSTNRIYTRTVKLLRHYVEKYNTSS